ncbi:MAG: hypothetical protein ACRDHN_21480 [Thermomicrobiales bacterium]
MTDHLHRHPHSPDSPATWENPNEVRDPWEERPREVAFWTIPLLLTMLSFAIVIIYFSVTN